MTERRFDPKEVKRILRRAGEIQSPASAGPASGPTLTQLQDAAAELGLSPDAVARAASELQDEPATLWHKIWGGPTKLRRVEVVDARLAPETRPVLVQRVRDVTGLVGEANELADGLEFVSSNKDTGESFHLSVQPEGGRTRLTVRADYQAALAYYLLIMFPGVPFLIAATRHSGSPELLVLLLAAMFATFLSARWMVKYTVRRGHRTIEDLMQALAQDIERTPLAPTMPAYRQEVEPDPLRARLT